MVIQQSKSMFDPLPEYMRPRMLKELSEVPISIPETIRQKIADFLCRQENKKTRSNYKRTLMEFCKKLSGEPAHEDFEAFFSTQDKATAAATIAYKRSVLVSFLKGEYGWGELGTSVRLGEFAPPKSWYAPSKEVIGSLITKACSLGIHSFALFIWFAYSVGQRLSDLLTAHRKQFDSDENGNTIIHMIASKTGKHITKFLPASLTLRLPKEGAVFPFLEKKQIQLQFQRISSIMNIKPIKAKNLRAAHISAVAATVEAARKAGGHSNHETTLASYLNPALLNLFDMNPYYLDPPGMI